MNANHYTSRRSGKPIRTPQGYWAFLPIPLPPEINWSSSLVMTLSKAERSLAQLAASAKQFPLPEVITQPFIHKEAVISSRIEGTRSNIRDLYTYEMYQYAFFENVDDVREVHQYVQALKYGLERRKTLPISLRLIRELHKKLMQGVRGGHLTPGEFRRSQNWIGPAGSTLENAPYVPPPVDAMLEALDNLEKFIHQTNELPLLVKVGLIHYQFEAIHPFLDGNGRLGRLLIILLLCEWELLPFPTLDLSSYFDHHRQTYYDHLLEVSQQGEWETWLQFFLIGLEQRSLTSEKRVQKIGNFRQAYQQYFKDIRNPERMQKIIDYLFIHPILTINRLSSDLEIPYKSAANYVQKLISADILWEVTGGARNRLYHAEDILQIFHNDNLDN